MLYMFLGGWAISPMVQYSTGGGCVSIIVCKVVGSGAVYLGSTITLEQCHKLAGA